MNNLQGPTRLFAILALVLILAGCSAPTVVVPPTADIPQIRTESASTVVAKLTIEAALNTPVPAATAAPIVITATSAANPTATQAAAQSAATATPIPTLTSVPTIKPVTGGSGGNPAPTFTPSCGSCPDRVQFVSQSPTDGKVYNAGNEFDGTWTLKNIGTNTWNSHYYYEWTGKGTQLAKASRYYLHSDVKPGDSITLATDMVAPSSAGRYVSYWQLRNENGDVIFHFYIVIDVK